MMLALLGNDLRNCSDCSGIIALQTDELMFEMTKQDTLHGDGSSRDGVCAQ